MCWYRSPTPSASPRAARSGSSPEAPKVSSRPQSGQNNAAAVSEAEPPRVDSHETGPSAFRPRPVAAQFPTVQRHNHFNRRLARLIQIVGAERGLFRRTGRGAPRHVRHVSARLDRAEPRIRHLPSRLVVQRATLRRRMDVNGARRVPGARHQFARQWRVADNRNGEESAVARRRAANQAGDQRTAAFREQAELVRNREIEPAGMAGRLVGAQEFAAAIPTFDNPRNLAEPDSFKAARRGNVGALLPEFRRLFLAERSRAAAPAEPPQRSGFGKVRQNQDGQDGAFPVFSGAEKRAFPDTRRKRVAEKPGPQTAAVPAAYRPPCGPAEPSIFAPPIWRPRRQDFPALSEPSAAVPPSAFRLEPSAERRRSPCGAHGIRADIRLVRGSA